MTDLTMSQFASKDDLLAAQAARIAELEGSVTHLENVYGAAIRKVVELEQGKCLHQIAEPAAPVEKQIKDAIDALVMAAFTEGGCSEHRMSEARIQTELRKKELCTLLSTPQPCCRSHPHEEMTPMCELRTEIARLTNALARAEAAAPQAVQAAVPLFWVRLLRDGLYEGPVHNNSVGGKMLRDEKPGEWHPLYLHTAPAHPAEGVPAQAGPVGYVALAALTSRTHADDYAPCFATEAALLENYPAAKVIAVYDHAAPQPAAQGMEALPMQASEGTEDVAVIEHPEWMLVHKETGAQKPLDSQWTVRATEPAAQGAVTTGYIAPKGRYVPPVLFSPYTGEPRDARDIASDPRGILIVPPGAALAAQAKQWGV